MIKQKSDSNIYHVFKRATTTTSTRESSALIIPDFFQLRRLPLQSLSQSSSQTTSLPMQSPVKNRASRLETEFSLSSTQQQPAYLALHNNKFLVLTLSRDSLLSSTYHLDLDFTVSFQINNNQSFSATILPEKNNQSLSPPHKRSSSNSNGTVGILRQQRRGNLHNESNKSPNNTTSDTDRSDNPKSLNNTCLLFKYSLKIYKHGFSDSLILYTQSEKVTQQWHRVLAHLINERGFHRQYKAQRKIGKGNFASVFMGERISDGKLFAIKAFSKHAVYANENGMQSLQNEIHISKELDHPNLVRFEKTMETDSSLYMIFQFVDGPVLSTKLQLRHKFTQDEIRTMMQGLLRGVMYLSEKGIVHRDLKPQNVVMKKNLADPVIVDFGLSTLWDQEKYLYIKCGTPGFVPPEIINLRSANFSPPLKNQKHKQQQLSHHPKCTPVADVFSLGCIFYQLVMGKELFASRNLNLVMQLNKECNFDLVGGEEWKKVPDTTADLLRKMLQKDPAYRINAQIALDHPYFRPTPPAFIAKIRQKQSALGINNFRIDKFEAALNYERQEPRQQEIAMTKTPFQKHKKSCLMREELSSTSRNKKPILQKKKNVTFATPFAKTNKK